MTTALFGYTGFVGGNLLASYPFDDLFNSANASDSANQEYDLVVFAAAKAEKWRINQDPEADLRHIEQLESLISGVRAQRFVLISTVDVYAAPVGVDETTPIDTKGLHAYGAHRYRLEEFVRAQHPNALIVRLPGLFGPGLKKNVVFDLLHDNNVDRIHEAGSFQYYNLRRLWSDLSIALEQGLQQVNLGSAPITTVDLARVAFGIDLNSRPEGVRPGRYDMRTIHAGEFGGSGPYAYSRDQTLSEIAEFVRHEKANA